MGGLKRNEAVESTALPGEVLAAIEGASFHPRPAGEDGAPRMVVQLCGLNGWMHGDDDAKRLAKAFPELTEAQLARACRYLAALVQRHQGLLENGERPERRNWVNNW